MDNCRFQSLAFYDDVELNGYKEAFEYVFNDNNIKNIALTGSYGAGKSSVIESYKRELDKQGSEHRFMHISLARFEQVEDNIEEEGNRNVEGKILNQLIHQLSDDKLQRSPININADPDNRHLFRWIAAISLFLLSVGYFCTYTWTRSFSLPLDWMNYVVDERKNAVLFIIFLVVLLSELLYGIGYLTQKQMKYHIFKKLCIKDNEINLFPEEESNFYFDKYMNEVSALFLDTESDVFVFEDLDRYNSSYIFEKLRELNTIINIKNHQRYEKKLNRRFWNGIQERIFHKDVEAYCPIRFLYLVRDDIFTQKDRTKFFDFIIPVVPVISGHNSFTMVTKYLNSSIVEKELSFIKQITLYVNDMRLVKNIVNEYQIYHEKLKGTIVNKTFQKMFAMVVFKNLFPKDYIELQTDHGVIVDMISKKNELIERNLKELQEENESLDCSIKELEQLEQQTVIKTKKELNALLFPIDKKYRVKNKTESQFNNRVEFVDALIHNPDDVEYYDRSYYNSSYVKETVIQNLYNKMIASEEYQEKLQVIEQIQDVEKRKTLEERLRKNKKQINDIRTLSLKDYLNEYGFLYVWNELDDRVKDSKVWSDVNNLDLLKMLLTNGYIDESYGDFLSVFHEGNLISSDKKYIRSVLDGDPLDVGYPINNEKEVSTYLNEANLRMPYARNIDMFCYYFLEGTKAQKEAILEAVLKYSQFDLLKAMMETNFAYRNWIPELIDYNIDILFGFSDDYPEASATMLLAALFIRNRGVIKQMCDRSDISMLLDNIDVVKFFQQVINHEEIELFQTEQEVDSDDYEDLISDSEDGLDKALQVLCDMGYKINRYVPDMINAPIVSRKIYEKDLYKISMDNMVAAFETFCPNMDCVPDPSILYEQIYNVSKGEQTPIYRYIKEYMPEYIRCKLDSGVRWNEYSESMIDIINGAKEEQVDKVISKMNFPIDTIRDIHSIERANKIIQAKKLSYRSENIFDYYDMWRDAQTIQDEQDTGNEVENMLSTYLYNYPEKALLNVKDGFKSMFNTYQSEHEIDDNISQIFSLIASSDMIQESKYIWLLNTMNRSWQKSIPKNVPLERLPLLFNNKIIRMSKGGLADARALGEQLLQQYILSDVEEYIQLIKEDVSANMKEMSFLFNLEFDNEEIDDYLCKVAVEYINNLLEMNTCMTKKRVIYILLHYQSELAIETRTELFIQHMKQVNIKDMMHIFSTKDWLLPLDIFEGKNPLVEKNDLTKKLLDALDAEDIIASYREDDKKTDYYRVYSKKNLVLH